MSTRDIASAVKDIYTVDISPDLISRVTDGIIGEMNEWQMRPLESVYPIVWVDGLHVKIREKSTVQRKCIYIAMGQRVDGSREVLGMWVALSEGAKFWLGILNDLKQRDLEDILILCADGLKGMPQAVEASFPNAVFQTCTVHLIRSSTYLVPWNEKKKVSADLKPIYTAINEDEALKALDAFDLKWGHKYPMVVKSWRTRWDEFCPFLDYPQEIRKIVYTTNAIEALNRILRKPLKTKGYMPTDLSVRKLLFMAYKVAVGSKKWGGRIRSWSRARLQFAIHFEGRFPLN